MIGPKDGELYITDDMYYTEYFNEPLSDEELLELVMTGVEE